MLENVIETIENCRYCLMCRHVAPVGIVTHIETLTPRGVALVAASQRRGMIEWDEESINVIFSEVDGGNSRMHCVNDQPFEDAIAAIRAELVTKELAPDVVYEIQDKMLDWGNPYGPLPAIEAQETGTTALLITDEMLHFAEPTVETVKKLLGKIDIQPVLIGGYSTGFLASSLGLTDTAKQQASRLIQSLEATNASRLIVLSPGDYYTITQLYDERLGVSVPDKIEAVELTTLLAEKLSAGELHLNPIGTDDRYAYVDPTHAVRVPSRHDAPHQLLEAALGEAPAELFWRRDRALPVGNTALQFTKPAIAEKLTRARLEDAKASGARILVTDDPATLHELNRFCEAYELETNGLFEVVAQAIGT